MTYQEYPFPLSGDINDYKTFWELCMNFELFYKLGWGVTKAFIRKIILYKSRPNKNTLI